MKFRIPRNWELVVWSSDTADFYVQERGGRWHLYFVTSHRHGPTGEENGYATRAEAEAEAHLLVAY